MKKKIALLLALTAVVTAFPGCGSTEATSEEDTESEAATSADIESESTESNDGEWELDGYTYEIPQSWTDLEVDEGSVVDPELVNKILEADQESEYGIRNNQILSVIYDEPVGDINTRDFQDCYVKLMENLGNPTYAAISVFYTGDEIKSDYKKKYYSYNSSYIYKFDDDTYLLVQFLQQADNEENLKYPQITEVSLLTNSELLDIAEGYIKETEVNSSYAKYLADEKGSY